MSKRSRHASSGPTVNINDLITALRQYNQGQGQPNQSFGAGNPGGAPGQMNLGSLLNMLGGQMGGNMPQMPGMGQGSPQMPGMGQGLPQMPGMGLPQMPGMGMPQMPGMGQGLPGISQMPGMPPFSPAQQGQHQQAQQAQAPPQNQNRDLRLLQSLFEQILLALKERE